MTALKCLAAAAVLALSAHAATACDDYADEMAMAAAKAAQVAQAPLPAPSVEAAAPATGVASVEPKPAETAGTVQR